jgi:hypothetical protein
MDGTIEERLRRLEDRIELQNLMLRYFIGCDDDNYEDLARVFADDAEYADGTGPAEIVGILRESRSQMGATIHTPDYMLIEFADADHASAVVGVHCAAPPGTCPSACARRRGGGSGGWNGSGSTSGPGIRSPRR